MWVVESIWWRARRMDEINVVTAEARTGIDLTPAAVRISPNESARDVWGNKVSRAFLAAQRKLGRLELDAHLLGSETPPSLLFTCARTYSPLPLAPRQYTHVRSSPRHAPPPPSMLAHVAIGIPVSGHWVSGSVAKAQRAALLAGSAASPSTAHFCMAGEQLACARHTWMAGAKGLAVLLLADCPVMLAARLASRNASASTIQTALQHARDAHRDRHGGGNHTPYEFPIAPWLAADMTDTDARVEARCYWEGYARLGGNYRMIHTMYRALLDMYPARRWYLKMDADTIILPLNLLRFVRLLDEPHVAGGHEALLYFGNDRGAYDCPPGASNVCAARAFKRGGSGGKHGTTQLRDTPGWLALEHSLAPSSSTSRGGSRNSRGGSRNSRDGSRNSSDGTSSDTVTEDPLLSSNDGSWNTHFFNNASRGVTYGWGAIYGLSAAAARQLVSTSCVLRVGGLKCAGKGLGKGCAFNVGGHGLNTWEDTAVGLCMHLLGAQLLTCDCFHVGRVDRVKGVVPWTVTDAVKSLMLTNGTFRPHVPHASRLRAVNAMFHDAEIEPSVPPGVTALCLHPIGVHAVKAVATEFLPMWTALRLRDDVNAGRLERWREAFANRTS